MCKCILLPVFVVLLVVLLIAIIFSIKNPLRLILSILLSIISLSEFLIPLYFITREHLNVSGTSIQIYKYSIGLFSLIWLISITCFFYKSKVGTVEYEKK